MSRGAACLVLAFLVLCSLKGPENQLDVSTVQAAPVPTKVSGSPVARPVRINFPAIALREAKLAGIKRPELFVRQIAAESRFDPCAGSSAGAQGIAQLMPTTANSASWGYVDPWMPVEAIRAASKAMAKYEKHYGSYELSLAAYNSGTGAVAKYNGIPPYPETRAYIKRIMGNEPLPGMTAIYTRPAGFTPEFSKSLRLLIRAVRARGGRLEVVPGNGHRTVQAQTRLWKEAKRKYGAARARNFVSPPFCSNHGSGQAADVRGDLSLAHRLAPRYGIRFGILHEPWHVSTTGY